MAESLAIVEPHEIALPNRYEVTRHLERSQAVIVVPLSYNLEGVYWRKSEKKMTFPSGKADIENVGPDKAAVQEINHEAGYRDNDLFPTYGLGTIYDILARNSIILGIYAALFERGTILLPRHKETQETLQFVRWEEMPGPDAFRLPEHYYAAHLVRANLGEIVPNLHMVSHIKRSLR